jgi:hypothetical protein
LFPKGSPIGRRYGRGGPEHAGDIEVIGVVKDVKYNSLDEQTQPGDYLPYTQNVRYLNDFEVRYTGDSDAAFGAIRQAIRDVDHTLPISDVMTLDASSRFLARSLSYRLFFTNASNASLALSVRGGEGFAFARRLP